MFEIDPAFIATSHALGDLALCHARLQGDARFPWIVLIPRRALVTELEDLAAGERDVLLEEVLRAGAATRAVADAMGRPATKLNIGQLGNVTPQLHVHVIARRSDDAAWPAPVWGGQGRSPMRRTRAGRCGGGGARRRSGSRARYGAGSPCAGLRFPGVRRSTGRRNGRAASPPWSARLDWA